MVPRPAWIAPVRQGPGAGRSAGSNAARSPATFRVGLQAEQMRYEGIDVDRVDRRQRDARRDARTGRQEDAVHRRQGRIPAVHAGRRRVVRIELHHAESGRHHQQVAQPRVAAGVQVVRKLFSQVGPGMHQPRVEPLAQSAGALRIADVQADRGAGRHAAHAAEIRHFGQHGGLIRIRRCHPVIRHHDEGDTLAVRERIDTRHQPSQQPVGALDAPAHVRMVGAEPVARAIDQREVERDQVRAFRRRQRQPRQDLLDPLRVRYPAVVGAPVAGAHAADVGFRSRKEERGRDHSLRLGGDPDRLAVPPRAVLRVVAAVAELRSARGVEEAVADDAVRLRMEPGGDGVVPREGQRGKDADEAGGAHAAGRETIEVRRVEAGEVGGVKAVERDEDDVRPGLHRGVVDPAGSGRLRRRTAALRAASGDQYAGNDEPDDRQQPAPNGSRRREGGVSDGA